MNKMPEEYIDHNTQKKIQTPQFKAVKGFNSRGTSGSNEKNKWTVGPQKKVRTHQD